MLHVWISFAYLILAFVQAAVHKKMQVPRHNLQRYERQWHDVKLNDNKEVVFYSQSDLKQVYKDEHFKVVFIHLEKCAGTSFESTLRKGCTTFGNTRWRQAGGVKYDKAHNLQLNWHPLEAYKDEELRYWAENLNRHDCLAGHFLADMPVLFGHPRLNGKHTNYITVTGLREPVKRIVSLFHYWKSAPSRYTGHDIKNFLTSHQQHDWRHVDNYYVRVFCPKSMLAKREEISEEHVACALEEIQRVSFFYMVEDYAKGTGLVTSVLGLRSRSQHLNKSKKARSRNGNIMKDSEEAIRLYTQHDQRIFELATSLYARQSNRTRQVPVYTQLPST